MSQIIKENPLFKPAEPVARMSRLETVAKLFATERHGAINHVRKYTGEPYINHPAAVVEILKTVRHTEEMVAAAWLHDTVEDTDTTLLEIKDIFGLEVSMYVEMLTDISVPGDGNREVRKRIDREHTAMAMPSAKTIKLADLIENSVSIIERDPKFAKVYMREKALLLNVLKEGDSILWKIADAIVKRYIQRVSHDC